jgi:hypothetical protein
MAGLAIVAQLIMLDEALNQDMGTSEDLFWALETWTCWVTLYVGHDSLGVIAGHPRQPAILFRPEIAFAETAHV